MTVLLTAVAFFILLSVLIVIHELGHFMMAKWSGVTVEEFGFGLPPRAKSLFKWKGTIFTLNWVPFGGFVRLKGENPSDEVQDRSHGSFRAAPFWAKVAILVAGVFMNFLLAIILFTVGFSAGHWIPNYVSLESMREDAANGIINLKLNVLIEQVLPDGTAAKAQVPEKSILLAIDGKPIEVADQVAELQKGKRRVVYTILSGKDFLDRTKVTVRLQDGKSGVVISTFPRYISSPDRSVLQSFTLSLRECRLMTVQTVYGIGKLFSSLAQTGRVPEGITGIVGIAQMTYMSVQQGFMMYLRLVAIISLSLAVMNILPFPALDGGRLLFVLFEAVVRRPLNRKFELVSNLLGFSFLILLILLITFYDILRLF